MSEPPVARREPHELKIHGVTLQDDYFWLRNKGSKEVENYLNAENAYAEAMMADTKGLQEQLFQEMKGRIKETDESAPLKQGDYYYYYRTEKGKDYRIYCRKHSALDAPEEIMLDGNLLAEGREYMNIDKMEVSPDQRMLAYTVDFTGGTTFDVHIRELSNGQVVDKVEHVGGAIEWDHDSKGVFYSELDAIHRDYNVRLHSIGTDRSHDMCFYEEHDTSFYVDFSKSSDREFLFIKAACHSSEAVEVRYLELKEPHRRLKAFFERTPGVEIEIQHHHGFFYFLTNIDHSQTFRLMRTPVSDVHRSRWEEVITENIEVRFPWLLTFQKHIVFSKRKDGYGCFTIYEFSSGKTHDIKLPESIYGLQAPDDNHEFESDKFRFVFSSPVTPTTVYDYDMGARQLERKKVDEIKAHNPSNFITERKYAVATDGTKIPVSIVYKKGTKMDGATPLVLYGYGSYGSPVNPDFDPKRLSLIERGIIFAFAHVRGGGEFGKRWYHQGKLSNKMNTFTDFTACADFLVRERYTSANRVTAIGASAGGLLMGAVVNLRPDLFASVVALVPFVDVISTMLDETIPLTTFEYKEWGDPRNKDQFDWMIRYSPYDNTRERNYPPMLITAGYNDSAVAYWEPVKWTAKLRLLKTDHTILLLKTRMDSGHVGFSGRYQSMREWAFNYAFILKTLDIAR